MITRILVPIDLSPSARGALEYATFLAGKLGAEIDVLHVWEPPGYVGPDTLGLVPVAASQPGWEETRGEARDEVERFLSQSGVGPERMGVRIEAGEASDTILQVAKESGADLIVMGTHGRRGLSRLLIGSVAEAVVRRSTCPVLTIRVPQSQGEGSRESAPP